MHMQIIWRKDSSEDLGLSTAAVHHAAAMASLSPRRQSDASRGLQSYWAQWELLLPVLQSRRNAGVQALR